MARPHLLLVDADPRTVRVLEVNLKNDGFSVTTAIDGAEAVAKVELALPDVLVAETRLPRVDGFEVVRRLRQLPGGDNVLVLLIAPEAGARAPNGLSASATDQLRAVELGIADCLTKPVSVRELVTRVNLMLARRTQALLAAGKSEQTRFSGHLQDIGVIDLLQAFESGRRSGILQIEHGARLATVVFKDGKVVDAEQGQQRGEEALYRTFLWTTGVFDVEFIDVDAPDNIPIGTPALLMEGMRRIDEWGRLAEQLPSSASVFTVDADVFLERLAEVPDELNGVLRLFDGQRSLMAVIDESPFDDLSTLSVVSKLFFEGVLRVAGPAPTTLLTSGRALGGPRVSGNVIKLPHVTAPSAVAVSVRPHAPSMRMDPVPRSLVYSEPPQNVRLSQRVGPATGAVSGTTLLGIPSAVIPPMPGQRSASQPAKNERAYDASKGVPEAEFEDVSDEMRERAASRSSTMGGVEESVVVSNGHVTPGVTKLPPESSASLGSHTSELERKPVKGPLEHDEFFVEGDQGTYDGGPSSLRDPEVESAFDGPMEERADIEIDPQILAALQARREQGQRWVKWIVGAALLLLVWGIVTVGSRNSEEGATLADTGNSVVAPPLQPLPPPPSPTTESAETAGDVFEDVSPTAGSVGYGGAGVGPKGPSGGAQPMPQDLPRAPAPRSKKPPTARFPSTPDNQ